MKELFIRFVVGGTVVSFFAVPGDLLTPKSFAGLELRLRSLLPHFPLLF